jgi:Tfp pilus assembly protein PilP
MWIGLLLGLIFVTGAIVSVMSQTGRQTHDIADSPQPAAEAVEAVPEAASAPTLQSLEAAWQHPLFNPDRQPDRVRSSAAAGVGLEGMQLTGVIIEGGHKIALFRQPDGRSLTLKEGADLNATWRVTRIDARRVELHSADESRVLQLATPRLPAVPVPPPHRDGRP